MAEMEVTLHATITITLNEYTRLQKRDQWLKYLEAAGVNNWGGMETAQDMAREDGFWDDEDD